MQADRVDSSATYDGVYASGTLCEPSIFQHFPFGEESEVKKKELHRERMRKWREKKRREREALLAMGINSQEIKSEIEREREKSRIRSKRWREKRKQELAASFSPEHLESMQKTEQFEQLELKSMETWCRPPVETALQNGSLDQPPNKTRAETQPSMDLSYNHQAPWLIGGHNATVAAEPSLTAGSGLHHAEEQFHKARKREQQRVYMRHWRQRKRLLTDGTGSASDDSCNDTTGDKKEQRRIYMRLYRQRKKLERDISGASFPYLSGAPSMVTALNPIASHGNECSQDSVSTSSNHGFPADITPMSYVPYRSGNNPLMPVRTRKRKPSKCCLGGTRKSRYQSYSQYRAKVLIGRSKMMMWKAELSRKWDTRCIMLGKETQKGVTKERSLEVSDNLNPGDKLGDFDKIAVAQDGGLILGEGIALNINSDLVQGNLSGKQNEDSNKNMDRRPGEGFYLNKANLDKKKSFTAISKIFPLRIVLGRFCIMKAKERMRKAANRKHMYWLRETKMNEFGFEYQFSSPESNKNELTEGEGQKLSSEVPSSQTPPVKEDPGQANATCTTSHLSNLNNLSSHQRHNHIAQKDDTLPGKANLGSDSISKNSISSPDDELLPYSSASGNDLKNGLKNAKVDPHIYSLMQAFLGSEELDSEGVQQSMEYDVIDTDIYNSTENSVEKQSTSHNISITQDPEPKITIKPVHNNSGNTVEPKASNAPQPKPKPQEKPKLITETPPTSTPKSEKKSHDENAMDLSCHSKVEENTEQANLKTELLSGMDMAGFSMLGLAGMNSSPYMASLTAYYQQLMALQQQSLQLQQQQLEQQQKEQLQKLAEQKREKEKKQLEKEKEQQKKEQQEKERKQREKEKQQQLQQQQIIQQQQRKEQLEQTAERKGEESLSKAMPQAAKEMSVPTTCATSSTSAASEVTSQSSVESPVLSGVVPPGMMMLPNPGMFGVPYSPMLSGYPFSFTSPLVASNLPLPNDVFSAEERRKEAARIRMRQWRQKQKVAKEAKGESDKEQEKRRANAERVKRWRERKKLEQQLKQFQGEEKGRTNSLPVPTAKIMSPVEAPKAAVPQVPPTYPELEGRSRSKMTEEERRKVSTERVRRWRERKRMERQLQMMQASPGGSADGASLESKSDARVSSHQAAAPVLPTVGSMWPPWMTR